MVSSVPDRLTDPRRCQRWSRTGRNPTSAEIW